MDHFICHMQAYVTKDQTARTIARILYDKYFAVFRFPQCLMSHQGRAFCGNVIQQLCDYLCIDKIWTSPYHPQSNGQVERIHQNLIRMIGKLDEDKRCEWPMHLGLVIHVYNATRSLGTGFSPSPLLNVQPEATYTDQPAISHHQMTECFMSTRTLDRYVTALYNWLQEALSKAWDLAFQEAHRCKRICYR